MDLLNTAVAEVLRFEIPADRALSQFFRAHPNLGRRNRQIVAETTFGILREKIRLDWLGAKTIDQLIAGYEENWVEQRDLSHAPLHVRAELPDWVIAQLINVMDAEIILQLGLALAKPAPFDLRVNTLKAESPDIVEELARANIEAIAGLYSPVCVRLVQHFHLEKHPLFLQGHVEVQDEGSQLVSYLLAPKRREMVIDFCAGAGGKTLHMAALMQSQGRLYAWDTNSKRLDQLQKRLKRSGASNIFPSVISHENDERVKRLARKCDAVLVDAPCTGIGTLRRNPDLKFRQSLKTMLECQDKQINILQAAAKLLKPGGRLVYATCSILPAENQQVIERFLESNSEFRLAIPDLPTKLVAAVPYLSLTPSEHGTDGFFGALLERAS